MKVAAKSNLDLSNLLFIFTRFKLWEINAPIRLKIGNDHKNHPNLLNLNTPQFNAFSYVSFCQLMVAVVQEAQFTLQNWKALEIELVEVHHAGSIIHDIASVINPDLASQVEEFTLTIDNSQQAVAPKTLSAIAVLVANLHRS